MRKILYVLLLGWASASHAHVGQHESGLVAELLHAFYSLVPVVPAAVILLVSWWCSRRRL